MRAIRFSLVLTSLTAVSWANPGNSPEVVSSRELNGSPVVEDRAAPLRVVLDPASTGQLELGAAEFLDPEGLRTIRIPVRNRSDLAAKVEVRTAFLKADGSVVVNPYSEVKGGFEGMARGFLGLISLGASEAALDNNAEERTIVTSHLLQPGQKIIVEHQLPFASDEVVGSRSRVALAASASENEHAKEVRRVLKEQYWKARDRYYQDKLAATAQWEEMRRHLEKERNALEPVSEAYRLALKSYWRAHQGHLGRLEALDSGFQQFVQEQEESLRSELGVAQP